MIFLKKYLGKNIENMEHLLQLKDSRAIAVPRNERLILKGSCSFKIQ